MTATANPFRNVVALPRPAATMRHVTLFHLDGRQWATAGFLPGEASAPWDWIVETVSTELECDPESVHALESEDGDLVTVDGLPVYKISC